MEQNDLGRSALFVVAVKRRANAVHYYIFVVKIYGMWVLYFSYG